MFSSRMQEHTSLPVHFKPKMLRQLATNGVGNVLNCRPCTRVDFKPVPGYPFERLHTAFVPESVLIVQTANSEQSCYSYS